MIKISNCTSDSFLEKVMNKKIVCFCAGQNFYNFCKNYPVAPQIEYIVDNFKCGSVIHIEDREIPIISMSELVEVSDHNIMILTSVKAADEIVAQLDQISNFNDTTFYVPEMFIDKSSDYKFNPNASQKIPKVIHYCWFGASNIPKHFQDNIDSWKRFCPGYEIKQWNENNYDVSKNKYMMQAYENKKWGFVPDYARLDIVNSNGGIYLDTDVQLIKSFDSLLQFELFCGFESKTRINFGQGFGAKKGHHIIREMINEYEQMEFINPDGSMNIVPSPVYQTKTLEKAGLVVDGSIQQKKDFIVFSTEYFSPINEFGYGIPSKNTFSIHQYAGSWYDEELRKIKERIIANYQYMSKRMSNI